MPRLGVRRCVWHGFYQFLARAVRNRVARALACVIRLEPSGTIAAPRFAPADHPTISTIRTMKRLLFLVLLAFAAVSAGAANLPRYTKLVEYIESDRKAYIDTKYVPNASTEIEMEFAFTEERSNKPYVFGSYGTSGGRFQFSYGPASLGCFLGYGNDCSNSVAGIPYDTSRHVVKYVRGEGFSFDGTIPDTGSVDLTTWLGTGASLFLGAVNPNGGSVNTALIAPLRIYSCKIRENGELVHDFMPASLTNGTTVCLYDAVDGPFRTSTGSGGFTAGPDATAYRVATYIETDRTAVVNTEYTPNAKTEIEMQFAFTRLLETKTYVFGVYGSNGGRLMFSYGPASTGCFLGYGNTYQTDVPGLPYNTAKHVVRYVPGEGFYFDGNLVTTASVNLTKWAGTSMPLYLCANNPNGGSANVDQIPPIRIYSCRIWEDGDLVRDLVPVQRVFDGKNGLRDNVTGNFYGYYGTRTDFTVHFPSGLVIIVR